MRSYLVSRLRSSNSDEKQHMRVEYIDCNYVIKKDVRSAVEKDFQFEYRNREIDTRGLVQFAFNNAHGHSLSFNKTYLFARL
jgi:hypothetical protein